MVRTLSALLIQCLSFGLVGASFLMSSLSAAEDLQTIQRRGYLVVAVKENLRPLGFRDRDGQLQGFEIEIARRLAQELLGKADAIVFQPSLNQDRLSLVLNGKADLTIARLTQTDARARVVSFSIPYYLDGTALVTRNPAIRKPADIGQGKVAVLNGSSTIETLRYRLPDATLIGVDSYQAAKDLLDSGQAIGFAADASVLAGWVQEFPQYRLLLPTLSVEPLSIVMPKGLQYTELQQRINQILRRWQEEDWLKQRAAYWGLP